MILAVSVLMLAGCASKADEEIEEDGGKRNNTDFEAAKTIESTKITKFSCEFSLLAFAEELEPPLLYGTYLLEAEVKDAKVSCRYCLDFRDGESTDESFEADEAFMDELQKIVSENDLAQHNGVNVYVSGLPDMYGAKLDIDYESGEHIYASDNQDCFLSMKVMRELVELFEKERT